MDCQESDMKCELWSVKLEKCVSVSWQVDYVRIC